MRTMGMVAWKDSNDAVRSLTLWVATVLLVDVVCAIFLFFWGASGIPGPRLESGIVTMNLVLQLLVELIALLVGFGAIVGERVSGSIKTLLGLPPTRSDVLLGTFFQANLRIRGRSRRDVHYIGGGQCRDVRHSADRGPRPNASVHTAVSCHLDKYRSLTFSGNRVPDARYCGLYLRLARVRVIVGDSPDDSVLRAERGTGPLRNWLRTGRGAHVVAGPTAPQPDGSLCVRCLRIRLDDYTTSAVPIPYRRTALTVYDNRALSRPGGCN